MVTPRPSRIIRHVARALYLEDRRVGGPRLAVVARLRQLRARYLAGEIDAELF